MSQKHIILVGFMGSGKSTVGKELSSRLNLPYVDSDLVIEQQEGKSVSTLFEEKGEDHFRELEKAFVESLPSMERSVIAVGGGLPCFSDNMERLKEVGDIIYLNVSVMTLTKRLLTEKENRPLLAKLSDKEFSAFVFEKLTSRTWFYRKANIIVPNESGNAEQAVEEIVKRIEN